MPWTPHHSAVLVRRDEKRHVRLISHLQYPFEHPSDDPYTVAIAYLRGVASLLKLPNATIAHLERTVPKGLDGEGPSALTIAAGAAINNDVQLRWAPAFRIRGEATVLMIAQTRTVRAARRMPESLDVEFAGLRIVVHHSSGKSLRITGLASALTHRVGHFPGLEATRRPRRKPTVLRRREIKRVFANFGLPLPDPLPHRIEPLRFLYRMSSKGRWTRGPKGQAARKLYCIANSIRVVPGTQEQGFPAFELVFRESNLERLEAKFLGTHAYPASGARAAGAVFQVDPVSASGDFAVGPGAAPAILNRKRKQVSLLHLVRPRKGRNWTLSGRNVYVHDGGTELAGSIGIKPPAPRKGDFSFSARTNDFAAVNAYYHLDRMFALIESLGMPFSSFPMGYCLPAPIVHRAGLHPGPCNDGNCINAQALLIPRGCDYKNQTVSFAFALADLSRNPGSPTHPVEPLGIACDVRVVWHEFCHALIAASTDFLELPFAHSAGDALAAINTDPDSRLAAGEPDHPYRGLTFPWGTTPSRRHDRRAAEGWSWSALGRREGYENDIRDMFGYAREQILSSTLFRLYRATGGDATTSAGKPDTAARKAAALYATYLIVRAICSLGPQRTVPAWNAESFATAMAEADIGTSKVTPPLGRIGGTVHKVIRWAFEKQGLFPDEPGPGGPSSVDLFLEDGRAGEYQYKADWQASPNAIWSNTTGNPQDGDQTPVPGRDNFIFVRVKNRGNSAARNVSASVFSAPKGQDAVWPSSKWTALPRREKAPERLDQHAAQDDLVFGPFVWTPARGKSYSFLARIEADGDSSNINPATMLPCSLHPTPLAHVVPFDNNIGLRTIHASGAAQRS